MTYCNSAITRGTDMNQTFEKIFLIIINNFSTVRFMSLPLLMADLHSKYKLISCGTAKSWKLHHLWKFWNIISESEITILNKKNKKFLALAKPDFGRHIDLLPIS